MMKEKVKENIKKHNLIQKGDSILIGFSGGMDSSALLYSLLEIREEFNLTISICHFNHGVRGLEADRDEEFSRQTAKDLKIYFASEKGDMHGLAKKEKISKEAAGRKLRQGFFNRVAMEIGANKIALAHNYNDQVETILMRILRGTGIDGLGGIDYINGNIIRPLLNVTRVEIEEYIRVNRIAYVEDSTNLENDYYRNRIRNILIPYLKEEYNPGLDTCIFNLSELAKLDVDFLKDYTGRVFEQVIEREKDSIFIKIKELNNLHPSIRNRLIRMIFEEFPEGMKNLSLENIKEVIKLKDLNSGRFLDNINGVRIRNSYGTLIFEKSENNPDRNFYYKLNMGINNIEGYRIYLEECQEPIDSNNSITIARELLDGEIVVRNRRNGDKISPIGSGGSKKLKDVFIDKKIDRLLRDRYLVIADSKTIFWVFDLIKSNLTKTESNSKEYIKIRVEAMEGKNA